MAEFEEEITRDISRQSRLEDLEDRTRTVSQSEVLSGRSAGVAQADILARTFSEDAPMRMRQVTQRESTNVEDRRFIDDPVDPDAPLAIGQRVVGDTPFNREEYETHRLFGTPDKGPSLRSSTFRGSDAWSNIVQGAGDAMDNVRTTLDLWLNPGKFPVAEGTSMEEREVIDRNKESRRFTGAVDLAGLAQTGAMGVGRALGPVGDVLAVGASRVPPPPKTAAVALSTAQGEAFQITRGARPQDWDIQLGGKKAGEFSLIRDETGVGYNIDGLSTLEFGTPRGTGLSRPVYDHFKQRLGELGEELRPSPILTDSSYNQWLKMDKDMVARGNYIKETTEEGPRWVRQDPTFSTKVAGKLEQPELVSRKGAPDQAVMDYRFEEGGSPQAVYRRQLTNQISSGQNTTLAPPPGAQIDVSYAPQVGQKLAPRAGAAVAKAGEDALATFKRELPDLQYDMESTGRSTYIQVRNKEGDNVLKVRLGDHAATRFDALSIDPVSGNTVETVLQALKFELGLLDQAPQVGWSYAPPHGMRSVINSEKGMNVFPQHRQIGGSAEYLRGGYSNNRMPVQPTTHTIGTDIQWDLTAPLNRAAE